MHLVPGFCLMAFLLVQIPAGETPVTVVGLRTIAWPSSLHAPTGFNSAPGVGVSVLLNRPQGRWLAVDLPRCRLDRAVDDRGTDLTQAPVAAKALAEHLPPVPPIQPQSIDDSGQVLSVDLTLPGLPEAEAKKLLITGTLTILADGKPVTAKLTDQTLTVGSVLKADGITMTITANGPSEWEDGGTDVACQVVAGGKDKVARVRFLDAAGKPVQANASSPANANQDPDAATYTWTFAGKVPAKLTVEIDHYENLVPVTVPVTLEIPYLRPF